MEQRKPRKLTPQELQQIRRQYGWPNTRPDWRTVWGQLVMRPSRDPRKHRGPSPHGTWMRPPGSGAIEYQNRQLPPLRRTVGPTAEQSATVNAQVNQILADHGHVVTVDSATRGQ
jgi:hypothetical protein